MSRRQKFKLFERKWGLLIALGLLALLAITFLLKPFNRTTTAGTDFDNPPMQLISVDEGSIASSTLLTGTVKVAAEEKIYFDASRGSTIAEVYVNVGDYVYQGQPLMRYATGAAQGKYDQAQRALNKIIRQIDELRATGATTTTNENGETVTTDLALQTYNNQLQDLYDSQADAQLALEQANLELTQTLEVAGISGRVVTIDTTIDPAKTGGQLIMHLASDNQLEVEGNLTESDLNSVSMGQAVKLTSKVYPDKSWDGKITYISYYPSDATTQTGTTSGANYPFKVNFGGDTSGLHQGFKVSIEVLGKQDNKIVPVEAVVTDGDKSYVWVYDRNQETLKKQVVTLGKADATNQEIQAGLTKDQTVVLYPSPDLTDGQKIKVDQFIDLTAMED